METNFSELITTTQVFHYKIIAEKSINCLSEFKSHHRLRVFHNKGTVCVNCGKNGTRLVLGEGRGGKHWDIYTEDLYPLTVDHIIPKSLGGSDELDNLQPMCAGCNFKKGNGKPYNSGTNPFQPIGYYKCSRLDNVNLIVGKNVWKRTPKNGSKNAKSKKLYQFGIVSGLKINPQSKRLCATILEKPGVLFDLKNIYILREEVE